MSVAASAQAAYVRVVRGARTVARRTHVLHRLEASDRRWARHARTLFAIHDVDDLASLDLPWWVYGAAEQVEEFLAERHGKARVFEYGSGASTLWLSRRAGEVFSVEHHEGFAELMAAKVADLPNVSLRHVPALRLPADRVPPTPSHRFGYHGHDFTDYVRSIDDIPGPFDLVVVDGRAREECLRRAIPVLADDGLVVFDNCSRRRYQEVLQTSGLRVERVRGATPCLPYPTETALLTRGAPAW
jgi:Methyltransferase domain